jgi:hypothetical protein
MGFAGTSRNKPRGPLPKGQLALPGVADRKFVPK